LMGGEAVGVVNDRVHNQIVGGIRDEHIAHRSTENGRRCRDQFRRFCSSSKAENDSMQQPDKIATRTDAETAARRPSPSPHVPSLRSSESWSRRI
jgi:hypothetical protein